MQLRNISADRCTVCDCSTIILEKVDVKHKDKNNDYIEYREFACGQKLRSSGSRFAPHIERECPYKQEVEEKKKKRNKARESILQYIETLDTDNSFKSGLKSAIHSVSIYY